MRDAARHHTVGHCAPMNIPRAIAMQEQAWALQSKGKFEEARIACREALQLIEESEGPDSPDVANLLNDLADIECERQDFPAALELAGRSQAIADSIGERFTGEAAARIRIRTLELPRAIRRTPGDYAQAETDLESA